MRSYKAAFAVLALFMVALSPVVFDDTDAASISADNQFTFDNRDGGTVTFTVNNSNGGSFEMDVSIRDTSGKDIVTKTIEVPAGETEFLVEIEMPGFTSVGTHNLRVYCEPSENFDVSEFGITITVEKTILTNWVTYAVIIIVVIVIAIFIYLKIRDTPKKKAEMTFEQLEAERKAEMASKGDKKKSKDSAPTTERQRYLADKKKKP